MSPLPCPIEYVDGDWHEGGDGRDRFGEPLAIVVFAEEAGPELPSGWIWWCLGKVGSAPSRGAAMARCMRRIAERSP